MNGAARIAILPKRRSRTDKTPVKMAGNNPTTNATHSIKKYASGHGNPAYVIGANVSHQHVPKKKIVPKIQPRTNAFAVDSFSRSTAHINGARANHARNQYS